LFIEDGLALCTTMLLSSMSSGMIDKDTAHASRDCAEQMLSVLPGKRVSLE
jgi:hypothetical protein